MAELVAFALWRVRFGEGCWRGWPLVKQGPSMCYAYGPAPLRRHAGVVLCFVILSDFVSVDHFVVLAGFFADRLLDEALLGYVLVVELEIIEGILLQHVAMATAILAQGYCGFSIFFLD